MPKLAANLTLLFTEVPFLDRFAAAAEAGFRGVEFLFPYDYDAKTIRQALTAHGLTLALHNLPAGDWAAGERGIACLPDRTEEFRAGVDKAIAYTIALECPKLNCLAGILPAGVDPRQARETFARNIEYAARRIEAAGLLFLIEAINTRDIPGFFLSTTRDALDLIDASGAAGVKLQYDVYHMQIMEGDLAPTIERHLARIGHIQIADTPGRHEPGTGEINYTFLLDFIDRAGYDGWIGCEYRPAAGTVAGLGWAKRYLS